MTLVKASIRSTSGGDALQCAFNPSEYSISKSAEWRGTPIERRTDGAGARVRRHEAAQCCA